MRTNAVELRKNMKDIMRAVERNEPVTVLYHGKEKAVILPIKEKNKQQNITTINNHPFFGMNKGEESVEFVMGALRGSRY